MVQHRLPPPAEHMIARVRMMRAKMSPSWNVQRTLLVSTVAVAKHAQRTETATRTPCAHNIEHSLRRLAHFGHVRISYQTLPVSQCKAIDHSRSIPFLACSPMSPLHVLFNRVPIDQALVEPHHLQAGI